MKSFSCLRLLVLRVALAASALSAAPLSLDELVRDIVAHHPELAFYEAEIDAARAQRRLTATLPPPELAFDAGHKRVRDLGGTLAGEGLAWSVSLAQTFEWPGRLALRKSLANRDVALAELGLARFRAALAARTRTVATTLDAARRQAAATAEVAARFQALREVFLARDPAGLTPRLETRVIEAQEISLRRRATDAAIAAHTALLELNQLRGAPPEAPLALAPIMPSFGSAPLPPAAALLAAARENNFEYRAARLELEQQGAAVSLARHERYPSFTLRPFYSQESAGERETTVGLGVSLPLPLPSRARSGAQIAEARHRQAEAAVWAAERALERAVLTAADTFTARAAALALWQPDASETFREAAALADEHYRLGAVPLATYLELQTAYLDAVEALLATQRDALDAAQQLQALTGLEFPRAEAQP
ncbi:TolC family protein [Horticoccus luteus]|uniref:TolC family protein n=1 Tax=Horticoccus luteus TaxID=2862869 RepID=A0A8F9XJ32_9BACT|nr:TolC family protein [Horticoccus luteus]QYM78233.1 TolC family protein [Horticoccus luteus]